jgi:EAL domain-containing protein (putative c-di-GMP-specific phosphodiesterase class I)
MGLIDIIDTMVMEMVIEELRRAPDVTLAFNVSNMTTENPVWLERMGELVKETPEIASRLIVEITETAIHRDLRRTAFFVASIQSMGCQVALDDFGSGYTSFRQLKALSVDIVKIDGVFIKDLAQNADNRFFVKTLLDFAQGFGLKTVAEFVETGEITKVLMEMGVDYMQGYYFGKPANHRVWLNEGEYRGE